MLSALERPTPERAEDEIPVGGAFVTRVLPSLAAGEFLQRRRRREARYLEEIAETFVAHCTQRVPLMEEDVVGVASLRGLGNLL